MGLAGRKDKQRIGADPRNLTWIDDSSKFGAKYLQSLGWSSGQGLGLTGDGRKDNIKIHQKLDLLGIGANRKGPGTEDWRAGREYDKLLSRLNQVQDTPLESDTPTLSGFNKASVEQTDGSQPPKKKRKRSSDEEENEEKQERKRRKEQKAKEKEAKKAAKRAAKEAKQLNSSGPTENNESEGRESTLAAKGPMYRAHRKRHLASKRLAAASSQSMKEILGVSSGLDNKTTELFTMAEPIQTETIAAEDNAKDLDSNLLRKSEKSMVDYFAEKLRLKKQKS